MFENKPWTTDEFAIEVGKLPVWSLGNHNNSKSHAFVRLAAPSELPEGTDISEGPRYISSCYHTIAKRVKWGALRYFPLVSTIDNPIHWLSRKEHETDRPWHIERMCLSCRKEIFKSRGTGYGVCADYD